MAIKRAKGGPGSFSSLDLQHPQLSAVTEILISQSALCGQKVQLPPGNALGRRIYLDKGQTRPGHIVKPCL